MDDKPDSTKKNKTNIVVSTKIYLKPIEETDAQQIFDAVNAQREYLGKWLPFVQYTQTVNDELNFIRYVLSSPEEIREKIFCIYYKDTFVGLISLKFNVNDKANRKAEIGYWLSGTYQNNGIMTQSVRALIRHAFADLDLNRVQIRCSVDNFPSKNIPKRLGFVFEGTERDSELLADGNFTDSEVYSILKKEWK